jgi:murein DD-endopeptidase MepM/ murein hydrolase activator NlpD
LRAKEPPVRRRRFLVVAALLAALLVAVPAALGDLGERKQAIDARISQLQQEIAAAKRRERVLTSDIAASREQIDTIQSRVTDLAARVDSLQEELDRHRARLGVLRQQYARQTVLLGALQRSEQVAEERLHRRLVDIYESGSPSAIEILFSVSSFSDLLSQLEYAESIARRDQQIASSVAAARRRVAVERQRTDEIRREEERTTAAVDEQAQEQRAALTELVRRRDELVGAEADRQALLDKIQEQRKGAQEELDVLQRESARLADRIRAAQSGSSIASAAPASSSGFIWPVSGPITSPFGWRWGRMHEGIDIGVGFGTPIHAAAAGTVIWAGWMGGYGNLVVIDHGGGISTAYGHQQRIYVHVGQHVVQGQTIGEVGSTGHSFGPHLHFEVRVNGNPVDPLGYL